MSDVEVYVVVEGLTEQTFVREALAPAMSYRGLYLYPALIGKPGHKGGDIRFDRAKTDIGNFLRQRHDTYASTMFDYFRIDPDWPGRSEVDCKIKSGITLTAGQKASIVETATQKALEQAYPTLNVENRFIPYIEMHEFEALLFSDTSILAKEAELDVSAVDRILTKYGEPEEIDDNPQQAPSKQIIALNSSHRKVTTGNAVAKTIGISTLRKKCPHFNEWLLKLEAFCGKGDSGCGQEKQ